MMMPRIKRLGLFLFVQITLTSGIPHLETLQGLPIYVANDEVSLACCSQQPLIHTFEFYKGDSVIHSKERDSMCAIYMFKIKTQQDTGPYYCAYKELENGTYVRSNMSNPITLQYADTPSPPSILLEPLYAVYTTKESVHLACVPPNATAAKGIQIYKENKKDPKELSLDQKYTIPAFDKDTPGKYFCKYWVEMNGRKIISSPSEHVTVNVTDIPSAPSLSVKPEHLVYIMEEAVTLTCSFPQGFKVKDFQFYRNGKPFPMTNVENKITFVTAELKATTTAIYTCRYNAEINGRTIASDSSGEVTINTTEQPPLPSVTLEPKHPVYNARDEVSVICSVPHDLNGELKSIKFYRYGQNIDTQKACKRRCIYKVSKPTKQLSGDYSCEYLLTRNGRELSAHSTSVHVTFTDIPPTPSIVLSPELLVYLKGESVNINCSIPEGFAAISIQYFKNDQEIHKPNTHKTKSTYAMSDLSLKNTGNYTCQYRLNSSGRTISSHRSLPVSISVEEIPQSPAIVLNHMWPVYTKGELVRIQCLLPTGSKMVHIHYFEDDKKFHTSLDNVYTISLEKNGNYSCGYTCNVKGREILAKTSQSVSISVVDVPRAPSIILNPNLTVYIKGETVNITCSVPEKSTVISIQFFKDNKEVHRSETMSYTLSNVSLENTEIYTCLYNLNISGRQISSLSSFPITILVEDPPITPVLMLAPNQEIYVVGESLFLTCSGFVEAKHHIYQDGKVVYNGSSHHVQSLQLRDNGNYTCTYSFRIKGRQMKSSRSQTVNIYVIDPLPPPTLTLGGPIEKLEDGFKLTLNCSAQDDDMLKTFYYFSTTEVNEVTNMTAVSAFFELKVGPISQISYICEYEQEMRGRTIRSRRSQTLSLQLSEPSVMTPPVIAAIIGIVSLLLCFALALWFYMKSKKYSRHHGFRFSWYWKEKQSPKKPHASRPLSPEKKTEEINPVLDVSEEGNYKTVSRNPSCLSIATQKEAEDQNRTMNFSTFHCNKVSDVDCVWNSSTF